MREVLIKVYKYSELSVQAKQLINSIIVGSGNLIKKSNDKEMLKLHEAFDRKEAEYFSDGTLYDGDN